MSGASSTRKGFVSRQRVAVAEASAIDRAEALDMVVRLEPPPIDRNRVPVRGDSNELRSDAFSTGWVPVFGASASAVCAR